MTPDLPTSSTIQTTTIKRQVCLVEEIFLREGSPTRWANNIHFMTIYVVRSFSLGSEPHKFEYFAGEDADVEDDQIKLV